MMDALILLCSALLATVVTGVGGQALVQCVSSTDDCASLPPPLPSALTGTWEQCCVPVRNQSGTQAVAFATAAGNCYSCDDDIVEFQQTRYSIDEGAQFVNLLISRWGSLDDEIVLAVELIDGEAIGGLDFSPFPQSESGRVFLTALLPSNASQVGFGVVLRDDSIVEQPESFTARLQSLPAMQGGGVMIGVQDTAQVLILDNDFVTVTIDPVEVTVNESVGNVTFDLMMEGTTVRDIRVLVSTMDGSAKAINQDYTPLSSEVTFKPANAPRLRVTVAIGDDGIVEGTESLFLLLAAPEGERSIVFGSNQSSIFIQDDDVLQIEFSSSMETVGEVVGSVTVEVVKVGENERPVGVVLSTLNGTAFAPGDFTAQEQLLLTFNASDASLSIAIAIARDGLVEAAEEAFGAVLSVPEGEGGVALGTLREATVTITDSDFVTVGFSVGSESVNVSEGVGVLNVMVGVLSGRLARGVSLGIEAVGSNNGATAGSDFSIISPMIVLDSSTPQALASVAITDDLLVEGREGFSLTLSTTDQSVVVARNSSVLAVEIDDNDPVRVAFALQPYRVEETGGSVLVQASFLGQLERPLPVSMETQDETALAGSDYTPVSVSLVFVPNSTLLLEASVAILDDDIGEGFETFAVQVLLPSNDRHYYLVTDLLLAEATVEIADNEDVVIEFVDTQYQVVEGSNFVDLLISKGGRTQQDFLVTVVLIDGEAIGGLDFSPFPQSESGQVFLTALLPSNASQARFGVVIRDDSIVEQPESFSAHLQLHPATQGAVLGTRTQATVSILDNDVLDVTFSPLNVSVLENSSQVVFTVSRDRDAVLSPDARVRVHFQTIPATASDPADFTGVSETLTFTNNVFDIEVSVPIVDDSTLESAETFEAVLSLPPGGSSARLLENSSLVTILDNDELSIVGFSSTNYTVGESQGEIVLEVLKLTGESERDVSLLVTSMDSTATMPEDYIITQSRVVLPSRSNRVSLPLFRVIDDSLLEALESFVVELGIPDEEKGSVLLGEQSNTTVFIQDNDSVNVTFALEQYVVPEGNGSVYVAVERVGGAEVTVGVVVSTLAGSATANLDFANASQVLLFPPSVEPRVQMLIEVEIIDDGVYEQQPEDFFLQLSLPADPRGEEGRVEQEVGVVELIPLSRTTILIQDNDAIEFALVEVDPVVESVGSVSVCVVRTEGMLGDAVTFLLSTRELIGEALGGGVDFHQLFGIQLTFEPGDTERCVSVFIVDDARAESPAESFEVTLEVEPPDVGGVSVTRDTVRVTIFDDDSGALVSIEQARYEVYEDAGAVSVCVNMSGSGSQTVAINLSTSDSNFTNVLFVPTSAVLILGGGGEDDASYQCVSIPILDNQVGLEGERSFAVSLALVAGAATFVRPESVVTVLDDDEVLVWFEQEHYSASEGSGLARVCVLKDRNTSHPLLTTLVPFQLSPPTAIAGVDFAVNPVSVSLPPSFPTACAGLVLVDNKVGLEGGERTFGVGFGQLPVGSAVAMAAPLQHSNTTVSILDDDIVLVEFTESDYVVNERDGAVAVCVQKSLVTAQSFSVRLLVTEDTAEAGVDFISPLTLDVLLTASSTSPACAEITIIHDSDQLETDELFQVEFVLPNRSGILAGLVSTATITITPDVIPIYVNDTVMGDPLFTVPLRLENGSSGALCYEIHGRADTVFSLISDHCTLVNGLYRSYRDLMVITVIAVRALTNGGQCLTVKVSLEDACIPSVSANGTTVSTQFFSIGGVSVRKLQNKVRISVPNCGNQNLVMWVTCHSEMVEFLVTRGLNLSPTSHGLIGQFWNVHVMAVPLIPEGPTTSYYLEEDLYVVTVHSMTGSPRAFVAEKYPRSWRKRKETCFYAGSSQGGSVTEVMQPNDPVIEGSYRDYIVSELFASYFLYSQFNETVCAF